MSAATGIEWTDATWNPVRGCSLVSDGCTNCYAMEVAARFSGPGRPYEGLARHRSNGKAQWTGEVRVIEKHMMDPIRWNKPRRVFVNSMSDLFHEKVSGADLDRIFAVMALAERHTFQVLTKRPERMRNYMRGPGLRERIGAAANAVMRASKTTRGFGKALSHRFLWRRCDSLDPGPWANRLCGIADDQWPLPNVWLGVSVEDQKAADERIPLLLETPAAVRFLSCEPLLGPVGLHPWLDEQGYESGGPAGWVTTGGGIDWVIVGGESGPSARPCDTMWIREVVAQCAFAGVACFVKQLGSRPTLNYYDWRGNSCEHDGRQVYITGDDGIDEHREPDARSCNDGQPPLDAWVEVPLRDRKGGDIEEWPVPLRVRQFPRQVAA